MEHLEKFSTHVFPSNPITGKLGSIDYNIWLAQLTGVPVIGLKRETYQFKIILLIYGLVTITFVTFIYTTLELYDLVLNLNNLDKLTQNICLSLVHFACVTKCINIYWRWSDVKNVCEKLSFVTRKYVISEKQKTTFFRGEFENKILLTIYSCIVVVTVIVGVIKLYFVPSIMIAKEFPYRVALPTWLPYPLQKAYIGVSVSMLALQIVAVDYLNMALINHIRIQLKILNLTFHELMQEHQNSSSIANSEHTNKRLNFIIEHHCKLIELRNEVESIFRIPLLIQFCTSLITIAVTGFRATVSGEDSNTPMIIYFYSCCILFELMVYCAFGELVIEQSQTLSTIGYSSSWYNYDQRFRKSLLIFIMNAQRPFIFTAGGFISLSLPSFAGILRKSYSYIALLHQMYGR